jgi:hypothetical protein
MLIYFYLNKIKENKNMPSKTLQRAFSNKESESHEAISVEASLQHTIDRYGDGEVHGELAGDVEPFKDAETAESWMMQSAYKLGSQTRTRVYRDGREESGTHPYDHHVADDLRSRGIDISTKTVLQEKDLKPKYDESPFYESERAHHIKIQDDAGGEYIFDGENKYGMDRSRAASIDTFRKPDASETRITYVTNRGEETEFSQTACMSSTNESSEEERALYAALATGLKASLESQLARIEPEHVDKVEGTPEKQKGRFRRAVGEKALGVAFMNRRLMYKLRLKR